MLIFISLNFQFTENYSLFMDDMPQQEINPNELVNSNKKNIDKYKADLYYLYSQVNQFYPKQSKFSCLLVKTSFIATFVLILILVGDYLIFNILPSSTINDVSITSSHVPLQSFFSNLESFLRPYIMKIFSFLQPYVRKIHSFIFDLID